MKKEKREGACSETGRESKTEIAIKYITGEKNDGTARQREADAAALTAASRNSTARYFVVFAAT